MPTCDIVSFALVVDHHHRVVAAVKVFVSLTLIQIVTRSTVIYAAAFFIRRSWTKNSMPDVLFDDWLRLLDALLVWVALKAVSDRQGGVWLWIPLLWQCSISRLIQVSLLAFHRHVGLRVFVGRVVDVFETVTVHLAVFFVIVDAIGAFLLRS